MNCKSEKIQSIRGLVTDGTANSLNKAIIAIDELRQMIIKDQQSLLIAPVLSILSSTGSGEIRRLKLKG